MKTNLQVVSSRQKSGISTRTQKPYSFWEITAVVGSSVVKVLNDAELAPGAYTADVEVRAGKFMAPVAHLSNFALAK